MIITRRSQTINLDSKISELDSRLAKLESVKQGVGGDIVDIISGNLHTVEDIIPANQGLVINLVSVPGDGLNHLIKYLWSMEIGQAGKIQLDVNYIIPVTTDNHEAASFANDFHLPQVSTPLRHSVVETSDGVLVAIYADWDDSLYFVASADMGATWTAPVLITSLTPLAIGSSDEYDADIDSNNNIYVTYHTGANTQSVFYRKLTRSSTLVWSVGSQNGVSNSVALWPSVCVLDNDQVVVGYTKFETGTGMYSFEYSKVVGGGGAKLANESSSIMFGRVTKYSSNRFMAMFWKNSDRKMYYNIDNTGERFAFDHSSAIISNWSMVYTPNGQIHFIDGYVDAVSQYRLWNGVNWSSGENLGGLYKWTVSAKDNDLYIHYMDGSQVYRKVRTGGAWGASTYFQNMVGSNIDESHISSSRKFTVSDLYYAMVNEDTDGSIIDTLTIYREAGNVQSGSISLLIEDTADDGHEEDDTTWDPAHIKVGEDPAGANSWDAALRFNDVQIPQGATINSAILSMIGNEDTTSHTVATNIKGIKENNAGAISSLSRPSGRSKTTAVVAWTIPDRTVNGTLQSPDIKTIIEEIVGQSGWVAGNSLILVLEDNANTDKKAIFVDFQEQAIDEWYNVIGTAIDLKFWPDLRTSNDSNGRKGFYWVIDNLTASEISIRLDFKGYATWQSSLTAS